MYLLNINIDNSYMLIILLFVTTVFDITLLGYILSLTVKQSISEC